MNTFSLSSHPYLLTPDAKTPPDIRHSTVEPCGQSVLDATTFQVIEIDALFDSINCANTVIGQATLYRSLSHPSVSQTPICLKQESLRELETDGVLRKGIENVVHQAKAKEKDFYDLLFATFVGLTSSPAHPLEIEGYGYDSYTKGTGFLVDLVDNVRSLPSPKSAYLNELIKEIQDFSHSRAFVLAKGPFYRSEDSLLTQSEKKWFTPAIRFQPSLFKPVWLASITFIILILLELIPMVFAMFGSIGPAMWLFLAPLALLYIPIVGSFDRDGCIYPLRMLLKKSPEVQRVCDTLGKLDELISFLKWKESCIHPTTLPHIVPSDQHCFTVTDARNPVLAKNNRDYVPNSITIKGDRLVFITGPNSGGKTAFCKTLAQIQLLTQIGSFIPAKTAEISLADRIFYQVPEVSHLSDGEGRFGTELRRTKDIFLATTAKSFIIMDELSEGTTHEEKIEISMDILDGFQKKGSTTILITHNHELVDRYQKKKTGMARQAEFKNEHPTYQFIEGVSRVSHADRVAKKIGFSKEDIARYLT